MDPLLAHALDTLFGRTREVKTLMGFNGRALWVVGGILMAVLAASGSADLDTTRKVVIGVCLGALVMILLATFIMGVRWPDQFHYGAEQRLAIRRMELADSLSGAVGPLAEKAERG